MAKRTFLKLPKKPKRTAPTKSLQNYLKRVKEITSENKKRATLLKQIAHVKASSVIPKGAKKTKRKKSSAKTRYRKSGRK